MTSTDTQHPAVPHSGHIRILIVEDDPALVKTFHYLLGDAYTLSFAKTGKQALDTVRRYRNIGAVLLDYQLPDMSGIDVLQSIKESRPNLPVIFVTAFGSEDVAVKAFTTGAVNYLKKPFSYAELNEKIRSILFPDADTAEMSGRPAVQTGSASTNKQRADHMSNANYYNIQRAVKYLEDNYSVKNCFEGAAEKACFSKYHFSRVFKEVMGKSFKEYLLNLKMEKAKELLRKGNVTMSQISDAVGYEDASYLIKVFKKRVGCTPLLFRQNHEASPLPAVPDDEVSKAPSR